MNTTCYSTSTSRIATELFFSSRATHLILRQFLNFPNPDALKKKLGFLVATGSTSDVRNINILFSECSCLQKICVMNLMKFKFACKAFYPFTW